MKRRINGGSTLGILLLGGGVVAMLADFSLAGCGRVAVISGLVLWCYHRLQEKNTTSTETYRLGYDLGHEAGYQERGEEERPTLVDIQSRRCTPAKVGVLSSAGRVVDRG